MTSLLRIAGIINAAIWFGAGIFFTFGVGPAIFSQETRDLFREPAFHYYAGGVALILIKRYFILHYVCGAIALLHWGAEKFYLGRNTGRIVLGFLVVVLGLNLLGGLWVEPKMEGLRQIKYAAPAAEQREQASRSFDRWHGTTMALNLCVLTGLVFYLTRVARPPEAGRYNSLSKFRS